MRREAADRRLLAGLVAVAWAAFGLSGALYVGRDWRHVVLAWGLAAFTYLVWRRIR